MSIRNWSSLPRSRTACARRAACRARSPVSLWYMKLVSGLALAASMRFQPQRRPPRGCRRDVDDVAVGAALLEQHLAGLRLRVVAAAQRAALVEDLAAGCGRRCRREDHAADRTAPAGRSQLQLVGVLESLPAWNVDSVDDLDLLLRPLADVAGKRTRHGRGCSSGVVQRSGVRGRGLDLRCRCASAAPGSRGRTSDRRCRARGRRRSSSRRSSVQCSRVEGAVGADADLEDALAVHDAVGVAAGIAVGAADLLRLGRRIVHRRVEARAGSRSSSCRRRRRRSPCARRRAPRAHTPATIASDRVPPRMAERLNTAHAGRRQ